MDNLKIKNVKNCKKSVNKGRILARKVARVLTKEEIEQVSGGVASSAGITYVSPGIPGDTIAV